MEKTEDRIKQNGYIILMLALYNFCFLGTEYFFDNIIGTWCNQAGVVWNQNLLLGISVLGFFLYDPLWKHIKDRQVKQTVLPLMLLGLICLGVMGLKSSYPLTLLAGMVCFVLMGIAGGAACYLASVKTKDYRHLGKLVGCSYGLGVFFQYVNNNWIPAKGQSFVIAVGMVLFCVLLLQVQAAESVEVEHDGGILVQLERYKVPLLALIGAVACMTVLFSTLDNAVTLVHAAGSFDIGQYPRLVLAASGVLAGILYDCDRKKLMPILMYLVTILSVMAIITLELGGSFLIGLFVFYLSAGFFVVFFMTSFMDFSHYTNRPKWVAGLGRNVNNLLAIIVTGISVKLLEANSQMVILIVALFLFMGVSICIWMYYHAVVTAEHGQKLQLALDALSQEKREQEQEDKLTRFIETHGLSPREGEVLEALLNDGDAMTEVSKKLAISRATLYRHIAKINEKTNTDSRMAIVQYYHKWHR